MRVLDTTLPTKTKYPILDTIIKCGFSPKKSGKTYMMCCPFHDDKTPSLVIYTDTQKWRCYGNCVREKNGGDAIDFVRQHHGYNYSQAVSWLSNLETTPFNVKWEPPKKVEPVAREDILYWHSLMDLDNRRGYFNSRGFPNSFIDQELWGWDGQRYTIPVWEGKPGKSNCIGVRRRKKEELDQDKKVHKYIGLEGHNEPTVWGRYYCEGYKKVLAFVGEFDSAKAVCDLFPSFSLVNGCQSFVAFPKDWPNLWFPDVEELITVFDVGEEVWAARFCGAWNSYKGILKARVFSWPFHLGIKDYNKYRESYSPNHFKLLLKEQGLSI